MRYLITGATGFVGGHVVDACLQRGHAVSAFVRPGSNAAALAKQGVVLHRGDLNDVGFLRQALTDVDVVVHCAAKVGDWGPVEDYRQVNVEGLRSLLESCKGQALSRFIHMSSLGVYAARNHYGTDETKPLPKRHRDGYSQSKVEAEAVAMHYYRDFGVPVAILRPGFVYGPRDRAVMPRLIENLRTGMVRYPGGKGRRALNTIFVRNLVDAVFLAVEREEAVGQIYNLTDGEAVSKRRFCEAVADAMELPRPTLTPPYWLAWLVTWCCDRAARLRGAKEAPTFSFPRLKFMGLNLDFSIEKAKMDLGYLPRVRFEDAIFETMAWYKENNPFVVSARR
ncbi:MAG: NAD-dependent epimerase/dehydratase family protein [Planctomycetes bacterium]|nr:NAD-dependent epimerase/dehydratase family protein [Planctomycetota bacterium]